MQLDRGNNAVCYLLAHMFEVEINNCFPSLRLVDVLRLVSRLTSNDYVGYTKGLDSLWFAFGVASKSLRPNNWL